MNMDVPGVDRQVQLTVDGLARDDAYGFADALGDLIEPAPDAVSIFEEAASWKVTAYYPARHLAKLAGDALAENWPIATARVQIDDVPDENWVALSQAALPPVHAGRFTICGAHDTGRIIRGPNRLIIDAGEAFGTAHHATTYGCLLALTQLTNQRAYRSVLDLGCGSGVLALAVQRIMPRARVLGCDIDERSVEVARSNARQNGFGLLGPRFLHGGLDAREIRRRPQVDLLIANILAGPLLRMAPEIAVRLAQGGHLVLSGILNHQAPQIIARYTSAGFALKAHARHNGWATLVFGRR